MNDPSQPSSSRLRELFLEALEKRLPAERRAFLEAACGGDRELRESVESLLAHHHEDAFLEESPAGIALTGSPALPENLPDEMSGGQIGRYRLLEKIGEGGCGVVYMAEQEEPVRRLVALKVIKLGMDTRSVIARFEAERQALAMMDHPNIARVLDAGATDQGRPYFVMELVRGTRITQYCEEHHLAVRNRLDLFVKVCQALQHAHQKGIIHRDIKPSNILVTSEGGVALPKVIDFGIAKATTDQRLTDKTIFTALEQFLGTPAYMSPEQAGMSGMDVDTRCDIYSLGVLLYEMLAGTPPFSNQELVAAGLDEMRRIIRETEPERPSTRLAKRTGTTGQTTLTADTRIDSDLDWIVLKCLEKDRARRYDTAAGLAADIRHHLSNEPVVARPPSSAYKLRKTWQRNKLLISAGIVVALVMVAGIAVSTWHAIRATISQQNEATHRRNADEARRSEAQLRVHAEGQELAARQRAYASDINLAQQALAGNNLGKAKELLNRQRPKSEEPELRGWEWRYLWQQCRSDALYTLWRQKRSFTSLSVSADQKLIGACEEWSGGLLILDVKTRQPIARMEADLLHARAAFSPRDSLIAFTVAHRQSSPKSDYAIRLWNSETRENLRDLPLETACVGMAFSGDGRALVTSTVGEQGQIAVWEMPDGRKLVSHPVPQDDSWTGTFTVAEDISIAAYKRGREIHVIDLASGQERWSARGSEEGVMALALSRDGKMLASGAGFTDSTIRLWDVATGMEIRRLEGHRTFIAAMIFWPDSKTLASAGGDQTIRLWDLTDPAKVPPPRVLRGHKSEVHQIALWPDNSKLVSAGKDGSICVWDAASTLRQSTRITLPGRFSSWRFNPDSKSLVTLGRNGSVIRWGGVGFREAETLFEIGTDFDPHSTLISVDTRLLAAVSTQGRLRVWDLRRGALLRDWTYGRKPQPFAFLANGNQLLTTDKSGGHRQWDLTTGGEMEAWNGKAVNVPAWIPNVSPDEHFCLTLKSGAEGSIRNLTTGATKDFELNLSEPSGAAFSPDKRLFAMSSGEGPARLWETATLQEVATFSGFLLGTDSVAFSPDSKRLAVGSSGHEAIKLWDLRSYQELLTLEGQGELFSSTAYSADGNVLGSMSFWGGFLHLWPAPSWEEIAAMEAEEAMGSNRLEH